MQVSITQLRDYLKCPQMAYYAHEMRMVPDKKPKALDIGTMFHNLMEMKLKARIDPTYAIDTEKFSSLYEAATDAAKHDWQKHKLWLPISAFMVPQDWEVVAVEHALSAQLGDVELVGRLDGIVKWNGKFWHLQWKTYAEKVHELIEQVRLSWHEVAYQYLASRHGYIPWGGTILGAVRKLPGYTWQMLEDGKRKKRDITDDERSQSLELYFVSRSPQRQAELLRELELQLGVLNANWHTRMKNLDMCLGGPGRRACPYMAVCHEGQDINGPGFIQVDPRY